MHGLKTKWTRCGLFTQVDCRDKCVFLDPGAFFITNSRRIIAPLYERIGLFIIRYG